jgi:hypothetical protein
VRNILTEKARMDILKDMVIVHDTREKKNQHIINYFLLEGIKNKKVKLDTGDYSCIFPNYPELGLDYKFLIERKGSLSELAGNFTQGRARFVREFERVEDWQKIHMVVESATWRKLFNGTYHSNFHPNSYKASVFIWNIRYNCPIWFCEKKESPEIIHKILHYEVSEYLKGLIK